MNAEKSTNIFFFWFLLYGNSFIFQWYPTEYGKTQNKIWRYGNIIRCRWLNKDLVYVCLKLFTNAKYLHINAILEKIPSIVTKENIIIILAMYNKDNKYVYWIWKFFTQRIDRLFIIKN